MKKKLFPLLILLLCMTMVCVPVVAQAAAKNVTVAVQKKKKTTKLTVTKGDKVTITTYCGKNKLKPSKVTFKSSNKKIATVNSKGVITTKKTGKVTINITTKNKKQKAAIVLTVKKKEKKKVVHNPVLSDTSLTLNIGDDARLSVKDPGNIISWSTSNSKVAVVFSDGTVIARNAGTCAIKAKTDGKTLSCQVTVKCPDPVLSDTSLTLNVGGDAQLSVKDPGKTISWSTTNPKVAVVLTDGTVIARNAGTCAIKARTDGKTLNCQVTVKYPDPECVFASNASADGVQVSIFEAKFVSYSPIKNPVNTNDTVRYYFPCTYRVHIKGQVDLENGGYSSARYSREKYIGFRFVNLWRGVTPDMPANNSIRIKVNDDGSFDCTEEVRMSGPSEIMYLIPN